MAFLQGGDLAGAIRVAQAILLKEPRNFDALHIMALASFHRRDLDTALRNAEKALGVRKDMGDAFNTYGLILRALSRVPEAAEQFSKAVKLNGRSREAHYNLANCLQDLGRLPAALDHYDAALKIDPSMLMAWNNRGLLLRKLGRPQDAVASFGEALKRGSNFAPGYYNRGDALAAMGRLEEAIADYDRALALQPGFAEAHCNRANALLELGRTSEALAGYERAVSLRPGFHQAHLSRGIAFMALGRQAEAEESFRRAIALQPGYAEAYFNLGKMLKEQKRFEDAIASYDEAIRLQPAYAEAHGSRGTALKELGRLDEALASFDRAIALAPGLGEAHSNRGAALVELQRFEEALASHDRAVALMPLSAEAHSNRGNALKEMNRLEEAVTSFDRAIALKPDYAEAYSNRGNALRELLRLDEALASFERASALKPGEPGMRYNMGIAALQAHRFREGFDLYQERWRTGEFEFKAPATDIPAWDGSPLAGRLLLWGEQGIGDEVFYASLFSLLDPARLQVTVSADRRLHPIYRRSFPGVELIDRAETSRRASGPFAAQAAIGDLGHLLGADAGKIAARRYPYLVASTERQNRLRAANPVFDRGTVCGISWRSGNRQVGAARSLALADLAPVLDGSGFSAVNLQYGEVAGDIRAAREEHGLAVDLLEDLDVFNDLEGLLAAIGLCDIVLTIDNVTAHLAGALGKPAIVLVPTGKGRYWYWGGERQSLWYPSLTLLYQERVGAWGPVLEEAAQAIRHLDAGPADR